LGCRKIGSKREFYSLYRLTSRTKKHLRKSNLIPKGTRKTKPKVSRRKETIKIRVEINEIETNIYI